MTEEFEREAERALAEHGAFEPSGDGFAVTTTPFEARVRVEDAGDRVEYRVVVRAPTIDAAVEGETVAPVVREGWFETFERRLEDVGGVTRIDPPEPRIALDADADQVVVEWRFEGRAAARDIEDAKALVDYVEGTYVQGLIPGYDYRGAAARLRQRAVDRSRSATDER